MLRSPVAATLTAPRIIVQPYLPGGIDMHAHPWADPTRCGSKDGYRRRAYAPSQKSAPSLLTAPNKIVVECNWRSSKGENLIGVGRIPRHQHRHRHPRKDPREELRKSVLVSVSSNVAFDTQPTTLRAVTTGCFHALLLL